MSTNGSDQKQTKLEALAKHLEIATSDIRERSGVFEVDDGTDWLVLTLAEAQERAEAAIVGAAWTFKARFLARHISTLNEDQIRKVQAAMGADGNEVLLALVDDGPSFIKACERFGRGLFLATHDQAEVDLGDGLFAYRVA